MYVAGVTAASEVAEVRVTVPITTVNPHLPPEPAPKLTAFCLHPNRTVIELAASYATSARRFSSVLDVPDVVLSKRTEPVVGVDTVKSVGEDSL